MTHARCCKLLSLLAVPLAAGVVDHAAAQENWPVKPLRIVTLATGGGSDVVARLISPLLTEAIGQQVVVENRGSIAGEIVAKSPPDGYTLLIEGTPLWVLPLFRSTPWDALRDFAPITVLMMTPNVLVVHPSMPVKSVKALITLARSRPGELNYAAGTLGANPHLAAELFKSMLSLNIVQVSYKGTGPGVIGLMAGEVDLMFPNAGSAMPYIKSGRLRALGVASLQESKLLPGVPAIADTVPGFETISIQGLLAPAGTAPVIIGRLNRELVKGLARPDIRQLLLNTGNEVSTTTPEGFSAKMRSDVDKYSKLIKSAQIRPH